VPLNLYNGFMQAKAHGLAVIKESVRLHREVGLVDKMSGEGLDMDLFPYGVKANQKGLDTLLGFSHEQGLTPRRIGVEELFAPNMLDL